MQKRQKTFVTRVGRAERALKQLIVMSECLLCLSCETGGQHKQATTATQDDVRGAQDTPDRHPGDHPETKSAALSSDPSPEPFVGTTEPVEQQRPMLGSVILGDVRSAAHEHFDRVVFVFQERAVPGYHVAYATTPAVHCGSGETVPVSGEHQLLVRLSPTQAHTEAGEVTVKDQERHLNLQAVKELELSCDFEGEVSWVLGLSARKPYRVYELADPARLVIDIQH